jgi:hypothetical protein
LLVPAGSRFPTIPEKMTSVAWPSNRGPITDIVTLAIPKAKMATMIARSGRSMASNRRLDLRKSSGLAGGWPPIMKRAGPKLPCGGRLVAVCVVVIGHPLPAR